VHTPELTGQSVFLFYSFIFVWPVNIQASSTQIKEKGIRHSGLLGLGREAVHFVQSFHDPKPQYPFSFLSLLNILWTRMSKICMFCLVQRIKEEKGANALLFQHHPDQL
jgi:hypothetical protein